MHADEYGQTAEETLTQREQVQIDPVLQMFTDTGKKCWRMRWKRGFR